MPIMLSVFLLVCPTARTTVAHLLANKYSAVEKPIEEGRNQYVITVIETNVNGNRSITIGSETIHVPETIIISSRNKINESDPASDVDPIEFSFWKKVKHAIDKGLKKLGDKIIDGLVGSIAGGVAG